MAEVARPDWARRCQTLSSALGDLDVDTLVVSAPANIRYLTGFNGSTSWLVVRASDVRILTDGRYRGEVHAGIADGRLMPMALDLVDSGYDARLAETIQASGARRIAFEAGHLTVAGLSRWQSAMPGLEWVPANDLVERLRVVKDATELSVLRRAGALLADVARRLSTLVAANRTEREIARAIDAAIEAAGFERPAFDTIVASGPNSAYPHARPTDRRLTTGDLVVLDFGGVLDGYCVDLTRMAAVGRISSEARSLVDAVVDAQRTALEVVRPGATSAEVDRAARGRLEERGLGPAFSHGTGHGLGLEVHEAPRISRAESGQVTTLVSGMVFTIEPGAYVEGVGGVRMEDDVIVTAVGGEVITPAPRELLVV
jgi:Xaa-Pro aminopeptidase